MKGLRKYLTPFAPDQSGAVSVLYELGGILVICDAGGCTGNVCGFDEPRWFRQKSAIFSAGLRDMDAILGRDESLVAKLTQTTKEVDAKFAAVIGTPVPAVIGTDYHALQRMAERKTHLPILTVASTGMNYYDKGAEEAYLALVTAFVGEKTETTSKRICVYGMNPLDMSDLDAGDKVKQKLQDAGYDQVDCFGMGAGLNELKTAGNAEKNLVVAPSGLLAARYMERNYGIPYEMYDPLAENYVPDMDYTGKKVLVLHQQITGETIRNILKERGCEQVDCGTWFMQIPELVQPGDMHLREEDQCEELLNSGTYDIVFGDPVYRRMMKNFSGEYVDIPQFAISGKLVANA